MAFVRPARDQEIGTICSFLHTYMDPSVSAERFRHLFTYPWMPDKPDLGFVIEHEDQIVGFISTIYADREINGRTERFCNLSSWYVQPEHRAKSLSLLTTVHRQGDLVFTNLTARPAVQKISQALRYQLLDTYKLFAFPFTQLWTLFRAWPQVFTRPEQIEPLLNDSQRRILQDHLATDCRHLLLKQGPRTCYLVWKRRVKQSVPFCELLFVSDPVLLRRHFELVKWVIYWHGRTALLAVDERLLGVRLPLLYPYKRVTLFLAKRAGRADIDNLYSELALL
jgi:acetoacetyl-CoA synthetase